MVAITKEGQRRLSVDVLSCSRRLDASEMVKIKRRVNQLLKRNHKRLLLDLTKTSQVDLAGLGILIERLKLVRSLKGDIKLCNTSREVVDTLRMVGVSNLIESYETREEAVESFCHAS